mmetsp:Transcript_133983/g.232626  ORF Transcript_133983/g.232626 Transcript_133983/m.232626 type:complete len:246 (-) Transcript_133983:632-1369(-)
MVLSKSALVAPIFKATPKPCMISAPSGPHMCIPMTLSVSISTIIFIRARVLTPVMVCIMGLNPLRKTATFLYCLPACSCVSPTVPIGGCEKTAAATKSWQGSRGLLPNSVSAKQWPSCKATGVRLMRLVTSPTAQILGTLVLEDLSTMIAPSPGLTATPAVSRPKLSVLAFRPVAYITWEATTVLPSSVVTKRLPSACFSTFEGLVFSCTSIPAFFISLHKCSRMSSSNPRKNIGPRYISVTLAP